MPIENLEDLIKNKLPVPNEFTQEMGRLIRQAREEQGFTQTELAAKLSRSQVAISDIETGKAEVSSLLLFLLAWLLSKPISYFIPISILKDVVSEAQTPVEQEMLQEMHRIRNWDLQRLAVKQTKIIADFYDFSKEEQDPDPEKYKPFGDK